MRPGQHAARADRRDALAGDHALAEPDVRGREVVVAYLEAPVEEDATEEAARGTPADFGDGA
jgi:hypothetical protein